MEKEEKRNVEQSILITLKILNVQNLFDMDSGRIDPHPEQVPTEYTEEQTLRAVRKQSQIPGQRKEKTINDFPKAAAVGHILKDLDFPADKQTIVNFVRKMNTPDGKEILSVLEKLDNEKQYQSVSEVASETRLVQG
jgi:hypothetical protein